VSASAPSCNCALKRSVAARLRPGACSGTNLKYILFETMIQIKRKRGIEVKPPPPRSSWCGLLYCSCTKDLYVCTHEPYLCRVLAQKKTSCADFQFCLAKEPYKCVPKSPICVGRLCKRDNRHRRQGLVVCRLLDLSCNQTLYLCTKEPYLCAKEPCVCTNEPYLCEAWAPTPRHWRLQIAGSLLQ